MLGTWRSSQWAEGANQVTGATSSTGREWIGVVEKQG